MYDQTNYMIFDINFVLFLWFSYSNNEIRKGKQFQYIFSNLSKSFVFYFIKIFKMNDFVFFNKFSD